MLGSCNIIGIYACIPTYMIEAFHFVGNKLFPLDVHLCAYMQEEMQIWVETRIYMCVANMHVPVTTERLLSVSHKYIYAYMHRYLHIRVYTGSYTCACTCALTSVCDYVEIST